MDRKQELKECVTLAHECAVTLNKFKTEYNSLWAKIKENSESDKLCPGEMEELQKLVFDGENNMISLGACVANIYGKFKELELSDKIFD